METLFNAHTVVVCFEAAAGVLAATLWVVTSRVGVPSPDTSGEGALVGGVVVAQDSSGKRLDVVQTFKLQSRWNRRAASASAATALIHVISLLL